MRPPRSPARARRQKSSTSGAAPGCASSAMRLPGVGSGVGSGLVPPLGPAPVKDAGAASGSRSGCPAVGAPAASGAPGRHAPRSPAGLEAASAAQAWRPSSRCMVGWRAECAGLGYLRTARAGLAAGARAAAGGRGTRTACMLAVRTPRASGPGRREREGAAQACPAARAGCQRLSFPRHLSTLAGRPCPAGLSAGCQKPAASAAGDGARRAT
jgi:hypothetical protein